MSAPSVVVVGGGLVGATAALGMACRGYPVTVIERQPPQVQVGVLGLDIRNVALSPGSAALLEDVGAWERVEKTPYHRMVVWEEWGTGRVEFDAAEVARTELGWLVEMSPLVCELWQLLADQSDIELKCGELQGVAAQDHAVVLTVDGEQLSADFVIAADGARSRVRDELGVEVSQHDMDQVALATVVRTERSHEHTAWQRFLHGGPLAYLPAPDPHLCSIVWSQTESEAQRRMALDDEAFCAEIGDALEYRLGKVTAVDKRVAFPLGQQRVADCAPHPRVLLIGDAMRVVHPLAGLGVNLGLEDVRGVLATADRCADLTAAGTWRDFARRRAMRSDLMIAAMSSLHRLYTSNDPFLGLLRKAGIQSFNALAVLKRQVMREAMGLR